MEHPATRALSATDARAFARLAGAVAGAFGVLSGFAIYMLWYKRHPNGLGVFIAALAAGSAAALVVEWFHDGVRGEVRIAPWVTRLRAFPVSFLIVAVIELFTIACEGAAEVWGDAEDRLRLARAILGPNLEPGNAVLAVVGFAGAWIAIGAVAGWLLSAAVEWWVVPSSTPPQDRVSAFVVGPLRRRNAAINGCWIALSAAAVVIGYVLAVRVLLSLAFAWRDPSGFIAAFHSLGGTPLGRIAPLSLGLTVANVLIAPVAIPKIGVVIEAIVIGFVAAIAADATGTVRTWALIVLFAFALFVVVPLGSNLVPVWQLPVVAFFVWLIPVFVLAMVTPHLPRWAGVSADPAARPAAGRWWSTAIAVSAVLTFLTAMRIDGRPAPSVVAALFVAGVLALFSRSEEVWPAIALLFAEVATLAVGVIGFSVSFNGALADVVQIAAFPLPRATPAPYFGESLAERLSLTLPTMPPVLQVPSLFSTPSPPPTPSPVDLVAKSSHVLPLIGALAPPCAPAALADTVTCAATQLHLGGSDLSLFSFVLEDVALEADDIAAGSATGGARLLTDAASRVASGTAQADIPVERRKVVASEMLPLLQARVRDEDERWRTDANPTLLEIMLAGAFTFWATVGLLIAWRVLLSARWEPDAV